MTQKDIKKEMLCIQGMFPSARIEWSVDAGMLFVYFKSGSFSCPCSQIAEIKSSQLGVTFKKGKKMDIIWRVTSETMMVLCYR